MIDKVTTPICMCNGGKNLQNDEMHSWLLVNLYYKMSEIFFEISVGRTIIFTSENVFACLFPRMFVALDTS